MLNKNKSERLLLKATAPWIKVFAKYWNKMILKHGWLVCKELIPVRFYLYASGDKNNRVC